MKVKRVSERYYKDFGEYIRGLRLALNMNQTDFGEEIGVVQGTISMWELGVTSPTIDFADEIVKRFGGKIVIEGPTKEFLEEHRVV